jgi:hypothetical protein
MARTARWRDVGDDDGDWWSFPSLQHVPSRSVRVWSRGLQWRRRTSSVEPVAPTPSYSVARQGPHQPSNGLGVPDPDASQGPNGPLGPLVERSIQHVHHKTMTLQKGCDTYIVLPSARPNVQGYTLEEHVWMH